MDAPGFLDLFAEVWNVDISGDPWYVLTSKLKKEKAALKSFNSNNGNLHNAVATARNVLLDFQLSFPAVPSVQQFEETTLK